MKKLPIGIESFDQIIQEGYYYVDKTEMIRDLLNSGSKVTLFTRPRCFGKSLNMDMLNHFFKTGAYNPLFDNLAISKETALCEKYQGKFPVISISLKDVDGRNFEDALFMMSETIQREIRKHQYLLQSNRLSDMDKEFLKPVFFPVLSENNQKTSMYLLSEMLFKYYGKKSIVLIDEYDVPLDNAYKNGYYDEMIKFMRSFFSSVFKTNEYLEFAVLTGCLRISRESIFTGLNNFKVRTISDSKFSEYFGFTDKEVIDILKYYRLENKYFTFKEWYNGYRFGNTEIYCPWDVINQCELLCEDKEAPMQSYWVNSSSNDIIKDILNNASASTRAQLEYLISGESIKRKINPDLTYGDLKNPDKIKKETYLWSILYSTGYLTDKVKPEDKIHTLVIPNKEILEIYKEQILLWFNMDTCYSQQWKQICSAVESGDSDSLENILNHILKKFISIRDTYVKKDMKENFYHGMLLGLLSYNDKWVVKSEQESGEGYPDILIEIAGKSTGCIFEIKYAENGNFDKACKKAMQQIESKKYAEILKQDGIQTIYKFGIAFYRKSCKVIYKQEASFY